jgi:acetate kinase
MPPRRIWRSVLHCPQSYFEQGVRRYGFHGLSYRYVSDQLLAGSRPVAKGGC